MGTPAYMSPEQARGKKLDKRTDVWAFGCCLYEALSGRKVFEAEDVSLTLTEVMESDPEWDAVTTDVPPSLLVYLRRCLEKDPKHRVRDIGDVRNGEHFLMIKDAPGQTSSTDIILVQNWFQELEWLVPDEN